MFIAYSLNGFIIEIAEQKSDKFNLDWQVNTNKGKKK